MKISYVKQTDLRDCGVSCLMSLVMYYKGYVRREYLREITKTSTTGVSVYSLIEAGSPLGFEARAVKSDIMFLKDKVPLIAHIMINSKLGHFVVVTNITSKTITVMDPSKGFQKYTIDNWNKVTTNVYLLYKPKNNILTQEKETTFIKTILPFIKKYKMNFLIVLILSFVYTISSVIISYGFQFFLNAKYNQINYIFLLLILILVLKELTNLFRNYLINYLNHSLDKTLIKEIYNHIIRLPYLYFKNRTKGDMITRIQDVFKIRDIISKLFVTISIDLVFLIIILFAIFKINKKVFIITLITTLIYILIIIIYNHIITKKLKIMKEKESLVNNHLIESISSIDTIKSMQIEDMMIDKLDYKYSNMQDSSYLLNKRFVEENYFKQIIYGLGILLIIYYGVIDVLNNKLDLSSLIVLYSLVIYFFEPINNISDLHLLFKESNVSFVRIKELLNIECENLSLDNRALNKHLKGNIKINNLMYSYNGIDDILNCQKLEIKAGNKVLLYGISGGGKSTLMKLLSKYFNNYQGEILIDNRDLNTYNLLDIRNKITYVSQDEIIYSDTIYNNIVLKNNINYSKYLEIIKLTGVDKIIKKSMMGDDMFLDNNASFLSGGEKQRIILARSLVKNSDIYIFDESMSAIDIKNERYLLKEIFKYLKNKTIIVISHRFNNRDLYEKFVLVDKGSVYEY